MGTIVLKATYAVIQFFAFIFVLVGTPIDQFRLRTGDASNLLSNSFCLTLWGTKTECYSTSYEVRPDDLWPACPQRVNRFKAAQALAIVSIGVFGVAFLFGLLRLCYCDCCFRILNIFLNFVGVASAGVVWACMADSYYRKMGDVGCGALQDDFIALIPLKFGAGFALFVTGWALCIVNLIVVLLPC